MKYPNCIKSLTFLKESKLFDCTGYIDLDVKERLI